MNTTTNQIIERKYLDKNIKSIDLENRLIVINSKSFREEFREPKYLICRVLGGAGCLWNNFGTSVFVKNAFDGEKFKTNRLDIVKVIKKDYEDEVIEKYCK